MGLSEIPIGARGKCPPSLRSLNDEETERDRQTQIKTDRQTNRESHVLTHSLRDSRTHSQAHNHAHAQITLTY